MSHSERLKRALDVLRQLDAKAPERVVENLGALAEDLPEVILGFAFADVLSRPAIDLRTREMLTVAALTAMGTAPGQLEFHMKAAMNVGVTREEIVEIVCQMAVYAGVPACMNGITAARNAFGEEQ